jgi:Transposase DDE domain
MLAEPSVLLVLVALVDRIPLPPPPPPGRGRPRVYPDRLFVKALVAMIVRRVSTVHGLLGVLAEPTPEMRRLRALLTDERGRFPSRRTWERRLAAIPATLPAQIACLGAHPLVLVRPWETDGRAAAVDGTVLRARGGVGHRAHRDAGVVPHTSIDTEAHWTTSGWHGWVYGYKLHLAVAVAAVWIPLAAELTAANRADNEAAPALLDRLPAEIRFVLGDVQYDDSALHDRCAADGRVLVTTRRGAYPHTDAGVEVRRVFHELRSRALENFNSQFKAIFGCLGQVPTRGLVATQRFALGAVLVYQLTLLHRHEVGADLRVGLKPFLQAA